MVKKGEKRPPRSKEWCQHISEGKKGKTQGSDNHFFGKHHTEETKVTISEAQIVDPKFKRCGEEHWNWKGGITERIWGLRHTNKAKVWRSAVFERDNYICQRCEIKGSRKHPINAHHIKPFAQYPKLGFEVSNGVTLCEDCHKLLRKITILELFLLKEEA